MYSYITSELARLHGEDLRRPAEQYRRGREIRRRRLPAVLAWAHSFSLPSARIPRMSKATRN
jgi:hypothetical protein